MKKLIVILAFLIPVVANAMKIEKDETDEFTGKRTLITSWESICNHNIHIRFRLQNGFEFLDFKKFIDGAIVVEKDAPLFFKSVENNIVSFKAIRTYMGERGAGATGISGSGAWGIYASYEGDLGYFNDNIVRLIRLYATDVYYDKEVKETDGKKLQKLYSLFLSAKNGEVGVGASYHNYTVTYFKSKNGGRTWDLIEEKYLTDQSPDEITTIMKEWQSKSTDKIVYKCKVKKE